MKNLLIIAFSVISLGAFAQVQIDKKIELTGSGSNAKIEGIEEVVNDEDAANKIYVDTAIANRAGGGGGGDAYVMPVGGPKIAGNVDFVSGKAFYVPFYVPADITVTGIVIDVDEFAVNSPFEFAIYDNLPAASPSNADESPNSRLTAVINATVTAKGGLTIAVPGTITLTGPNYYWLGILRVSGSDSDAKFVTGDHVPGAKEQGSVGSLPATAAAGSQLNTKPWFALTISP